MTEQLRRKRGRPRKVVIVEDASGVELPSTDDEADSESLPNHEQQVTRLGPALRLSAVTQLPRVADLVAASGAPAGAEALVSTAAPSVLARSQITRRGHAHHGTVLTAPLPMEARMLLVQDVAMVYPPLPPHPAPPGNAADRAACRVSHRHCRWTRVT